MTAPLYWFVSSVLHAEWNESNIHQGLLASYTDVYSRKCVKCGRLLDSKPQFPAARRKRTRRSTDGDDKPVWDAYHEGCL